MLIVLLILHSHPDQMINDNHPDRKLQKISYHHYRPVPDHVPGQMSAPAHRLSVRTPRAMGRGTNPPLAILCYRTGQTTAGPIRTRTPQPRVSLLLPVLPPPDPLL